MDITPEAQIIDATHDILPGDIEAGAWVLSQYWRLYPQGTIHVAVVDPGVGSARKALALAAEGRCVVAPDNGLVTGVIAAADSWRCVEIAEPRYMRPAIAPTFHGRDIFAPAAAHLAGGVPLEKLGPPLTQPQSLDIATPRRRDSEIRGRIAHVDHFGNLITDIPGDWLDPSWQIEVGSRAVGAVRRTYSDAEVGELVVVVGSLGTVEIAARDASAAQILRAARGGPVTARR